MSIEEFLSPEHTLFEVKASDKARLLHELAARAGETLRLSGPGIAREVLKREQLGSTGMGNGIAIPHARTPGLDRPFGIFAKLKRPIDYQAIDGLPVDLVFLLLQPASSAGELNALAAVARKLREPERLKSLRKAHNADALYRGIIE